MRSLFVAVVAVVLCGVFVADADAQCRLFGRLRDRRQARFSSCQGMQNFGPIYGQPMYQGGCGNGQCGISWYQPQRPVIQPVAQPSPLPVRPETIARTVK